MKPADLALCIMLGLIVGAGALALANKPKPASPGPTVVITKATPTATPVGRDSVEPKNHPKPEEVIPGLLWISGLEKLRPAADSTTWYHPVRPQEIEITIQTLDGQKWTTFIWDKVK